MKNSTVNFIFYTFFIFLFSLSVFAQTVQQGAQTTVACKSNWDCSKLDYVRKLDQNQCIDQVYFYDGRTDPLLPLRPYVVPELLGRRYTKYIQIGYTVHYVCGKSGFCEIGKIGTYDKPGVEYMECRYGCLVTPTEKNGKVYSNFCVCLPGSTTAPLFCDPSRGPHAYYQRIDWTCELEIEVAGYCAIGTKCQILEGGEKWACVPLEGIDPLKTTTSSSNGYYTFVIPGDLESKPISVALIQNGKIVAEKPISNMSALEYINKYGPVNSANAYAFAKQVGLTSLASADKTSTTATTASGTGASTTYASTKNSGGFLNWLSRLFGFGKTSTKNSSSTAYTTYAGYTATTYSNATTYPYTSYSYNSKPSYYYSTGATSYYNNASYSNPSYYSTNYGTRYSGYYPSYYTNTYRGYVSSTYTTSHTGSYTGAAAYNNSGYYKPTYSGAYYKNGYS